MEIIKTCEICNNNFLAKTKRKKYCSEKCLQKSNYNKNKEKIIKRNLEYQKNNPEKVKIWQKKSMSNYISSGKMKESMKKQYENNKHKWQMRRNSNYWKKQILEIKGEECEICKSKENIEIHHLDYTWEKDIFNKLNLQMNIEKIKILCRNCHHVEHNKIKNGGFND